MTMNKPALKELIKSEVRFEMYRQGIFYYRVWHLTEKIQYLFPVPADDIGTATLLASDKAITFMRWIRKALEDGTLIHAK